MSESIFRSNRKSRRNPKIAVLNIILNFILSRGWTDYDNFALHLTNQIFKNKPSSERDIIKTIKELRGSFFSLNSINKGRFVEAFPSKEILKVMSEQIHVSPLSFADIFKETSSVSIEEGKKLVPLLEELSERTIQNALRDSLREKNATNPYERNHDTPLEIADLEHFILQIKRRPRSFACQVKGFKSISHRTVTWKDVSHQITKTYQGTFPDHVLLVLAKNPTDGLITNLTNYAKSVNNPNLIILCDPVELARFLRARKVI